MTKSRVFLYLCLSFVVGIFINSIVSISQLFMLGFLILGILLIFVLWRYKKFVVIGFCLLFLIAGIWRHQAAESEIYYPEEQDITFTGAVVKEPDVRANNIKLTIKSHGKFSREIKGMVLVTTNRYPEYQYGDKLKISGRLKIPHVFEDFNYKDYLTKDGIYSVIYWPEIELLGKNDKSPTSIIFGKILEFKDKLRESIYRNLSPPQSAILGAMVLGDKRRMSEELKEKLNIAGIRHITAVSGLHIAILTSILMTLLIGFGFWRRQAFYFSMILIVLFIIMTGLQPSAIRAGIMGGLFLFAQNLGRMNSASRTIVFAATAMLVLNPFLLRLDVGFQLSFLAVMGIIYLGPAFRNWLKFIPEKSFLNLRSIISMTLSAQIFTLPILIYNFGYMSLVAPITNILIVPLLPHIMILGFVFGLAGILWQPLGWILSLPVWLLLTWVTKTAYWFSNLPLASLAIESFHWAWLIPAYLILGYIAWRLDKRRKSKFLNY